MAIYLVPALIALAVLLAVVGVRMAVNPRRKVEQRLQALGAEGSASTGAVDSPALTQRSLPPFWRMVSMLGWVLPNLMQSEDLQWSLAQGGIRRREAPGLFVGTKIVLALILGILAFFSGTTFQLTRNYLVLWVVAAAALGFYLPNIWLASRTSKRRDDVKGHLPDALDLMVVCVEAGQGLNAALTTVGRELRRTESLLGEELLLINHEIQAGLTRANALRNFAWRCGVEEARSLSAVLIQSDRLGTSVAQALRVHAESMRTKRRQRAEETARKTSVKMLFPLVFCIFPALLVVILAPGMIQLLRSLAETSGN